MRLKWFRVKFQTLGMSELRASGSIEVTPLKVSKHVETPGFLEVFYAH